MKARTKPAGSGRQRPADLPKSGELVKVSISARVDKETAEWVKSLKNKSAFLRAAIAHHKNLKSMSDKKRLQALEDEYEETREAYNRQEMQEEIEAENPDLKLTAASDADDYAIYRGGNIMVIIKPVLLAVAGLLIFKYIYG